MKSFNPFVLWLMLPLLTPAAFAQTCRTDIAATAPDSRYQIHNNGTVTDKETGLMWKVCAEGQTWSGGGCHGSAATFTWPNALQRAATANSAKDLGYNDWRLPNKNELASLVEERCVSPAINAAVFSNTPSLWFWSSSPYAYASDDAWGVSFNAGGVYNVSKDAPGAVRLVRAGQSFASLPAADTTPDAFQFDAKTHVALSSEVISNAITVRGINAPTTISVQHGEYRINGGGWRSRPSTVNNGDKIEVLHTASDKPNREIITTLTIGGVSAEFKSTTAAPKSELPLIRNIPPRKSPPTAPR